MARRRPKQGDQQKGTDDSLVRSVLEILSNVEPGRLAVETFSGDDIPSGQNIEAYVLRTISLLESRRLFTDVSAFFDVFATAIDRAYKYDAWPEYLHLYFEDIDLDVDQEAFLYLAVMRWVDHYADLSTDKTGFCPWGNVRRWREALVECSPCACDFWSPECRCDQIQKMEAGILMDELTCSCHMFPHRNLYALLSPPPEASDFHYLKRELQLLPNNRARLAFVLREKASYEQAFGASEPQVRENRIVDIGYTEKCRIEIEKLERLVALGLEGEGSTTHSQADSHSDTRDYVDDIIRKPRLTVDQFIMLMFAIGGRRIRALDKNDVAEGLSALTGYSVNSFVKKFSEVLPDSNGGIKKWLSKPTAYNKDVRAVANILDTMGLSDEAEKLRENSGE